VNEKQRTVVIATLLATGVFVAIWINEQRGGVYLPDYEFLAYALVAAVVGGCAFLWLGGEKK